MRQVTDLKEIQYLALEIFKAVKVFCEEKDITYYLAYGTLLGAIRHKDLFLGMMILISG